MGTEAVDTAGAGKSVAMGDLDGIDAGFVEGTGDGRGLGDGVLVTHGMHAVPQGDVADIEVVTHVVAPAVSRVRWAMVSAVDFAAEVMMSRLPA